MVGGGSGQRLIAVPAFGTPGTGRGVATRGVFRVLPSGDFTWIARQDSLTVWEFVIIGKSGNLSSLSLPKSPASMCLVYPSGAQIV